MDHSIAFARHFARLLWLLLNEPGNIEEQKASLRALVLVSRDGPVRLGVGADGLLANGQEVGGVVAGVAEVADRLVRHGPGELSVHLEAQPADILEAARLLAAEPMPEATIEERLREAGSVSVHFMTDPGSAAPVLFGEFDLVHDAGPEADALLAPPVRVEAPAPKALDPRAGAPAYRTGGTLFDHFAAVDAGAGRDALLAELGAAQEPALGEILNRVVHAWELAQRAGDGRALLELLLGVIRREARAGDGARREIALTLRRMLTGHALRLVAALVPRRAAAREDVQLALGRMPEEGADAVIELLTQAPTATDRRAYFELLLSLKSGVPTLLHMLGDDRWYVVRNAVDLLGELGAREAEQPITRLLTHADERVRQSATVALLRLDTPAGRAAVLAGVQSASPAARQQAVAALGTRRDANTASMLLRALDREQDETVQRSIYVALGKVASPDAVERLIRAAEPGGSFFRRKPSALRAAAVAALGEARTPAALQALRGLIEDREKEVRETALRSLAAARRGGEPRVTAVFDAIRS